MLTKSHVPAPHHFSFNLLCILSHFFREHKREEIDVRHFDIFLISFSWVLKVTLSSHQRLWKTCLCLSVYELFIKSLAFEDKQRMVTQQPEAFPSILPFFATCWWAFFLALVMCSPCTKNISFFACSNCQWNPQRWSKAARTRALPSTKPSKTDFFDWMNTKQSDQELHLP